MNNIENTYVRYDDLVEVVGDKVIKSRIKQINQKMIDFLDINNLNEVAFTNFLNMLYYHLKFRKCDAKSIELMLLAFKTDRLFG